MANTVSVIIRGVDQWSGTLSRATKDFAAFKAVAATAVLSLATAAIAAAASAAALTQSAINTADAIGKTSQKAGVAVEDFSALAYSAGLAEVSQEDLVKAAKAWSQEAGKGQSITGSFQGDLLELADQFARAEDGARKVAIATEVFGKAGQAMIPLLNQGREAIRAQMQEAERLGLVVGKDFAANADTFNDNLDRLKRSFEGLWMQVAQRVLPTLVDLSDRFLKWTAESGAIRRAAYDIATGFQVTAEAVDILLSKQRSLSEFFSLGSLTGARQFAQGISSHLSAMVGAGVKGLASLAGGNKPGEFITVQDTARVKELIAQMVLSNKTGLDRQLEDITSAMDKRLAEIDRLNIGTEAREKARLQIQLGFLSASNAAIAESDRQKKETEDQANQRYADELVRRIEGERKFTADYTAELLARVERERAEQAKKRQILHTNLAMTAQHFGYLSSVAEAFGSKGFAAYKAFASAEALIATISSAVKSYDWASKWGGPIAGAAAAAIATAAGLARVAQINSTSPRGSAHAGLSNVPEDATYAIQGGERIVSRRQNLDLTRFLNTGDSAGRMTHIVVNLDGRSLLDYITDSSRDGRLSLDARSVQ